MIHELEKLYNILAAFLGDAKNGFDDSNFQYQFSCPRCVEKYGQGDARKYNLECNLQKQVFKCWKCGSENDDMHGSILKLIRLYGNDALLKEYMDTIHSIRESELYKLHFSDGDFNIDTTVIEREELKFPPSFQFFDKDKKNSWTALKYLNERGIGWDIIERFKIGFTTHEDDVETRKYAYRVIIPSYNELGELNYWVGRDYLPKNDQFQRTKYANPKAEKKEIIFNEEKIQWDADITLVEGAFDHIVVPNSIPLLGKALDMDYKLYWELVTRANEKKNVNINIWLDDDAKETAIHIYSLLNHGNLYGKVRMIESGLGKDPSEIFEKYGYRGIIRSLQEAKKIPEHRLF